MFPCKHIIHMGKGMEWYCKTIAYSLGRHFLVVNAHNKCVELKEGGAAGEGTRIM